MGSHLVNGKFQSDKYPSCPPGKVPLSVSDKTAQDLLWEYAQRRRSVDAEFSDDLEVALREHGYPPQRDAADPAARSVNEASEEDQARARVVERMVEHAVAAARRVLRSLLERAKIGGLEEASDAVATRVAAALSDELVHRVSVLEVENARLRRDAAWPRLSADRHGDLRRVRAILQRLHHREPGEWGDPLDGCLAVLADLVRETAPEGYVG